MIIVHEVVLQARVLTAIDDSAVVLLPVRVMVLMAPSTTAISALLLLH